MKRSLFQLVKFAIIGTSNTAIDALIYAGLTRGFSWFGEHYLVAAIISFIISGLNGFYWNRRWTFAVQKNYSHDELGKFYAANSGAFVLNQLVLWFLVKEGVFDIFAKVLAGVSAGIVNFLLQKLWTFTEKEIEELVEFVEEHTHQDDEQHVQKS